MIKYCPKCMTVWDTERDNCLHCEGMLIAPLPDYPALLREKARSGLIELPGYSRGLFEGWRVSL